MLMDASRITGLPLATAWYVGDQLIDLAAARAAGVKRYFHVGTSGDLCDAVDVECLGGFAELTGHLP
jgi:phosphoglycolate phosphatase-like HAD superfamily hydrolase